MPYFKDSNTLPSCAGSRSGSNCQNRLSQATRCRRLRSRFCRSNPIRCRLAASTDKATVRANPSAPWLRTRSSPRCSNPLMADSTAGCARRAATKHSSRFPLLVGLRKISFARQGVDIEQPIEQHPVVRTVKAPVETARPQLRIQCLRFLHHRHRHVHVLALPQNLVVKDELILILDQGDRNPEFNRRARLAFRNPPRVFLENRKDLLLVRNRLATQKTPPPLGQSAAGRERRGR